MAVYDSSRYDGSLYDVGAGLLLVELNLNSVWTDVTAYVFVDPGVNITRGRQDEQSSPSAATMTLTLDDSTGRFSPKNTAGAYYPYLTIGTQVRVSFSGSIRFVGNVYEYNVSWSLGTSDTRRVCELVASGPRRRLARNAAVPLPYRLAETNTSNLVAYWPMEDGAAATTFASALSGGAPATFSGSPTLAADSTFVASEPLPTFGDAGTFSGAVPSYVPDATGQQVRCLVKVTGAGGGWLMRIDTNLAHYFLFEYAPATTVGLLQMRSYADDHVEASNGPFVMSRPAAGCRFSIELKQNGTGIDCNVVSLAPGATSGGSFGVVTIPSATLGRITNVSTYSDPATGATTVLGHVTVENHITSIFDMGLVLTGYAGETADARVTRLAAAYGVAVTVTAPGGETPMGPQSELDLLSLIDEAATVTHGLSTELVDSYGLSWRGRTSIWSKSTSVVLPLTYLQDTDVVYDDQYVVNDVTLTRPGGSSARYVVSTGNAGTSMIGAYQVAADWNVQADTQLLDHASWIATEGTLDLPRLPVARFDVLSVANPSDLTTQIVSMREGDTIQFGGFTAGSGLANPQKMLVLGWSEHITASQWLFDVNVIPSALTTVFILNSATWGVLDTDRLGF